MIKITKLQNPNLKGETAFILKVFQKNQILKPKLNSQTFIKKLWQRTMHSYLAYCFLKCLFIAA